METSQAPGSYLAGLARKRMAAGVLFTDPAGHVLLVEPTYKDYWEVPGGAVEVEESPYDAAVRELKEELDLSVAPGRLLVVDWVPPRPIGTEGVMFLFDGGVLTSAQTAQIVVPPEELAGWAWCTLTEARQRLSELLARRVETAVQVQDGGGTAYLESGYRVA